MTKKKVPKRTDKKTLTFFLIGFPSVVIAMIGMLDGNDVLSAAVIISFVIYQFVMLKQFVDQYYEVL